MIKLRLIQPSQPEITLTLEGDSAVIGRDAKCDVVVNQPFVSKRHTQILNGIVVLDLGSSNGTFVAGTRIAQATLVRAGRFSLGKDKLEVAVETDGPTAGPSFPADEMRAVRDELENERARFLALESQASELRVLLAAAQGGGKERYLALYAENEDLRRRLATMKGEVEGREIEASVSLQARLAEERLLDVQRRNEELRQRVEDLEAGAPSSRAPGTAPAPLAQPAPGGIAASELFFRLQKENQELREKVAHLESGEAGPPRPASALFFQMQTENRELRQRVAELEAASGRAGTGASKSSAQMAGSAEIEGLRRERDRLQRELAEMAGAGRGASSSSSPQVPSAGPLAGSGPGVGLLHIARSVVNTDVDDKPPLRTGPVEDFLALETLRFLRKVERVVTRVAGDFVQLYQLNTMLPNVEGSLRSLAGNVLRRPADAAPRDELTHYLEELRRWLVAALGAPRKASAEFAAQLRHDLTEEALTAGRPISVLQRLTVQREAELWRRASAYLKELTPDMVEDRLEKLGRKSAQELLDAKNGAD